jgi:all-trans-retinol 13,14-reductase
MKYDVIVIGAGFGGLSCATKLAKHGKNVLLLEKNPHSGGTSHIFRRSGYVFPMGALGFSYPQKVKAFLESIGIEKKIDFKRNHYQLVTPFFDIMYSLPFDKFKKDLKHIFPEEEKIDPFFVEFEEIITLVKDISSWHPDYLLDARKLEAPKKPDLNLQSKMHRIDQYSCMPCNDLLDRYFSNPFLKNLLGSQGTRTPTMSVLNLALMWNIMSIEGIWFPSCGIHGLIDLMEEAFRSYGGELKTSLPVEKICVSEGRAKGVLCRNGEVYAADWIVSSADYKKTFFELIENRALTDQYMKFLREVPYTRSELCVYLGIDPNKANLEAMKATHLFYRHEYDPNKKLFLEDFENREMEICLWSDNIPGLTPPGRAALILRIGFPIDYFSKFWIGEKKRKKEYKSYKERLASDFVKTAENILPGLGSAIEVMDIATPLTYQDWGQRHLGSLAGWAWSVKNEKSFGGKILVETPIPNVFMAGIYAAMELFLGGVPTAIHTGSLAADLILRKERKNLSKN